jgi:hypothetical protein
MGRQSINADISMEKYQMQYRKDIMIILRRNLENYDMRL